MKRKIFEGKCPWNGRQMVIYLDEEGWQNLTGAFQISRDLKIVIQRWWQSGNRLDYFLYRAFKIKRRKVKIIEAQYHYVKHIIRLYPEMLWIFMPIIINKKFLKYAIAMTIVHEFQHALDRVELLKMYLASLDIKSKKERRNFLRQEKERFETRAERFGEKFWLLFVPMIEIEIF